MKARFLIACLAATAGFAVLPMTGCSSSDDPAPADTDGGDAGLDRDSRVVDDRKEEKDAGCVPHEVKDFTPPAPKRTHHQEGACPGDFVTQFLADCLSNQATDETCANWTSLDADEAHRACAACMVTPEAASTYGAIINVDIGFFRVNTLGCTEILSPVDGTACADHEQKLLACQKEACNKDWCPVVDDDTLDEWQTCADEAAAGTCEAFGTPADDCERQLNNAITNKPCFTGTDFLSRAASVGKVICGGGDPPDGGTGEDGG